MATSLDMSLDDLIKRSSSQRGRGRGRGRGQGQVQVRSRGGGTFHGRGIGRLNGDLLRVKTRPSPYKIAKARPKLLIFFACVQKPESLEILMWKGGTRYFII